MAQSMGKLYVEIAGNASKLVNEVGKVNKSLSTLELAAKRLQSNLIGMFGSYAVIGAIKDAVSTLAEFDKVMTQVSVITGSGKTSAGFDQLERSALRLGSTTQFTAKQVAELQLEFGRLGFSTREILQSTDAVVDLATATGEGLARSAEIAGSTLRAFNLDASEMYRVTDVMAASLNESALTLDSFAEGIKYVAPVAAATNVSLEETAAMLSVLADAGIKGSMAGTSLRRIFTMLTDTGKPLQQRLDELAKSGITLAQANDEVGLYAQTSLLILTEYKKKIDELNIAYKAATGETRDMARAMEDNLATSITKVSTAYDALILSLSNSKGLLKGTADTIAKVLRGAAAAGPAGAGAILAVGGPAGAIKRFMEIADAADKSAEDVKKLDNAIAEIAKGYVDEFGNNIPAIAKNIDSSISTSIYKKEILTEVTALLEKKIEDEAKALTDNTAARVLSNKEIKESIKLEKEKDDNARARRIRLLDESRGTTGDTIPGLKQLGISSAKEAFIDTEKIEVANRFSVAMGSIADNISRLNYEQSLMNAGIMKSTEAWMFWGDAVAGVLDNVIAKDQDFAKSAAETAARVIDASRKEIAIYIAKAAAKALSLNPTPAGIAQASAIIGIGLSLVSGVLKRFAKTSDVNTRATGSSASSVATQSGNIQGSVVIRGQDLYVAMNNYNYNNRYTKAGG